MIETKLLLFQAKLERVLNELSKAKEMNAFYSEDNKGAVTVTDQSLHDNKTPSLLQQDSESIHTHTVPIQV